MSPDTLRAIQAFATLALSVGVLVPIITLSFSFGKLVKGHEQLVKGQEELRDAALLAATDFRNFAEKIVTDLQNHRVEIERIKGELRGRRASDRVVDFGGV